LERGPPRGQKLDQAAPRRGSSRGHHPGLRRALYRQGSAEHLYETVYSARGQAENFIKLHKTPARLRPDLLPLPPANQFRLILHTAAYWQLLIPRAAVPKRSGWKTAEFATVRLRLITLAARVVEGAASIRVWLPTACPDAAIFRLLAGRFAPAGP
jgi:hypothetical protein